MLLFFPLEAQSLFVQSHVVKFGAYRDAREKQNV